MMKAILFDHDGTLVDSEHVHYLIWKGVLAGYGVDFAADEYEQEYSGIPTPANSIALIARYALPMTPEQLTQEKLVATDAHLSREPFPLMHAARESVQFFHEAGARLAIVSGSNRSGIDHTVQAHGLGQWFSTIVSFDDVSKSKPAPECYQLTLARLGIDAAEAIAIEDTEHGIQAATAAGIVCCGVRNAMSRNHDFSRAIKEFDNLEQATEWISANYRFATSPPN